MLETELKKLTVSVPALNTLIGELIISNERLIKAMLSPEAAEELLAPEAPPAEVEAGKPAKVEKPKKEKKAKEPDPDPDDDDDDDWDDDDDDEKPAQNASPEDVKKLAKEVIDKKMTTRAAVKKLIISTGNQKISQMEQEARNSVYFSLMNIFKTAKK